MDSMRTLPVVTPTARPHAALLLVLCTALLLASPGASLSLRERPPALRASAAGARGEVVHASGLLQGSSRASPEELQEHFRKHTADAASAPSDAMLGTTDPFWRRRTELTGGEAEEEEQTTLQSVELPPLSYYREGTTTTAKPSAQVIDVHTQKARVPVTLVGDAKTVLRFTGEAGNVINAVVQVKNRRYDPTVSRYNCEGMYVGVSLRTGWVPTEEEEEAEWVQAKLTHAKRTSFNSLDEDEGGRTASSSGDDSLARPSSSSDREEAYLRESETSFWSVLASLLDTSPLCKMYQSVSMRLSKAPRTEDYFVVLSSAIMREYRHDIGNPLWEANFQCALEIYLSQDPAQRLFTLQLVFSLVLPLLVVLVPLPFFLRHVDIIHDAILDVDIGDWFWLPPYLLRKLLLDLTVGTYTRITTYRLEKREQARQRELEERQQQLSREMNRARDEQVEEGRTGPVETQWSGDAAATSTTSVAVAAVPREEREGMERQDTSSSSATAVPHSPQGDAEGTSTVQCTPAAATTADATPSAGGKKTHDVLFTTASREEEDEEKCCRICRDGDELEPLVAPCACIGSVRWIHRSCLDHWRMESAKRNLNNVNHCEICKQPFNLRISRAAVVGESAKRIAGSLLLLFTSLLCLFLILAGSYGGVGELSCLAMQHEVAYSSVYTLEGLIMALLVYSIVVVLAMMSHMIVYSWFRCRADVVEYVRDMRVEPPFWSRRNGLLFLLVLVVLAAQVTALGYLAKIFIYSTSTIVWNWEIAPILGCVCAGLLLPVFLHLAQCVRAVIGRWRSTGERAEDVVIENAAEVPRDGIVSHPRVEQSEGAAAPVPEGGAEGDAVPLPPEMRVIRAVEYCPPRRPPLRG